MAGKKRKVSDMTEHVSHEQIVALIQSFPKQRDRALVSLCYLTGGRISELVTNKVRGYPGIKRSQIRLEELKGENFVILHNVPVLKRRKHIIRNIPIPVSRDKILLKELMDYAKKLSGVDPVLFPISRVRAWQIVNKLTGWFNHYFRHLRTTHLVVDYGFSPAHLREFHGWATSKPADVYTHLNWRNVAEKMT